MNQANVVDLAKWNWLEGELWRGVFNT